MDAPRQHNRMLTPSELVKIYPGIIFRGWDKYKIGAFYNAGLLLGKRNCDGALILESSFVSLVEFAILVAEQQAILTRMMLTQNVEFWTPKEICDEFPQFVTKLNWDAQFVGLLLSTGFLNGVRLGKEGTANIVFPSFMRLLEYVNELLARRMLNF